MGVPLLDTDKHVTQYIGPLGLWDHNTLLEKVKDQFNGALRLLDHNTLGDVLRLYLLEDTESASEYTFSFTYVLPAVLNDSVNSCPPERLFSIFNLTFDDDQKSSYADYMRLSIQSQFNERAL